MTTDMNELIQQLKTAVNQQASTSQDDAAIIAAAAAIARASKNPFEQLMESMANMMSITILRVFVQWGVFAKIPADGMISYEELAEAVNADVNILGRFCGALTGTGFLLQPKARYVSHSPMSKHLAASFGPLQSFLRLGFDTHFQTFAKLPAYFDKYGRKEPVGRYHTPLAFALGDPELTVWEHTNRIPDGKRAMMNTMEGVSMRQPMVGTYDFTWLAELGQKSKDQESERSDRVLLVDIGGSKGHCIRAIVEATPGLEFDRCILEDLEEVVEEVQKTAQGGLERVKFMTVDFHSSQPVKGAALYYIRRCLHDYSDQVCIEILQHISDAMADDSRLLIVEQILGEPPSVEAGMMDVVMATIGGKERTRDMFGTLATAAGLKVNEIYPAEGSDVGFIECVKIRV